MRYIVFSLCLLLLSACSTNQQKLESSNAIKNKLQETKVYFTLDEYKEFSKNHHLLLSGLELLNNNSNPKKNYPYVKVKNITNLTFQKFKNIIDILNKDFFNKYKTYFSPFDASKLTQIIYKENKALVSFGYMQDKWSMLFGDFLLKLDKNTIKIYELDNAVGCSMPIEPLD